MKALLTIALTIIAGDASAAGLPSTLHPRHYCALGAAIGYPTRPYNESTGGCASDQVDIGSKPGSAGMVNNLAFYSRSYGYAGQPTKLERVSMILNVNNTTEATAARMELIRVASAVSKNLLGSVPVGLAAAITKGKTATWTNAEWRTDVIYSNWNNGRGYDISIRFTPARAN
jgi:hypothetical protein